MKKLKQRYSPPGVYASFSHPNHSISTLVYNHAFKKTAINAVYVSFDCQESSHISAAIRSLHIKGASVSMPHKENVLAYIDEADEHVKSIGAVNVIRNKRGKLEGFNTDWIGAVRCLSEKTNLRSKSIAILGAGGAARAIAYGLSKYNCRIVIFNRTKMKAEKIVSDFMLDQAGSFDEIQLIEDVDIVINAIPFNPGYGLGTEILNCLKLKPNQVILDIVIHQTDTPLITKAKEFGCKYLTGVDMYIYQAVSAFEIFTGKIVSPVLLRTSLATYF